MDNKKRRGFTLAELLIVVAIIAVLVAVAIPVFSAQLKKAKASVIIANLRSAYAEAVADRLTNEDSFESYDDEYGTVVYSVDKEVNLLDGPARYLDEAPADYDEYLYDLPFNIADIYMTWEGNNDHFVVAYRFYEDGIVRAWDDN